jgi:uncharacterized protein YkwD
LVLLSIAVPTRRSERASAAVLLVALTLGAGVACSAMVTAQPRLTSGTAMAGAVLAEHAVPAPARAARTEQPAWAADPAQSQDAAPAAPTTLPTTQPTTTPTTTPPTTSARPTSTTVPVANSLVTQQQRVVELVNVERAKVGCRAVVVDARLVAAAQAHSTDMATNNYFSHTSQDGSTFADRILAAGYPRPAAENIAQGYGSADDVMRGWMRSRGHRANILNCEITAIGVGLDTRGWYWTQDFGR